MTPEAAFGMVLQALRQERGWSQEELGFRCGLHRVYVGLLERGKRSPSLDAIYRLARALGVAPSDLLARVEALSPDLARKRRRNNDTSGGDGDKEDL